MWHSEALVHTPDGERSKGMVVGRTLSFTLERLRSVCQSPGYSAQ
jgi:hypothetical protein